MPKEWTPEQWKKWHELVEWSHKAAVVGTKKLLSNAGIKIETLTSLAVFNIEDDVAHAIRRGAIRILNELNGVKEDERVIW